MILSLCRNNGATMDGIPRGSEPAAVALAFHRAKRGFGLAWIGPILLGDNLLNTLKELSRG